MFAMRVATVLLDKFISFRIYAYANAITRILSLHERTTINE